MEHRQEFMSSEVQDGSRGRGWRTDASGRQLSLAAEEVAWLAVFLVAVQLYAKFTRDNSIIVASRGLKVNNFFQTFLGDFNLRNYQSQDAKRSGSRIET